MGTATVTSIRKQAGKRNLVRRSSSDGSRRIRRIVQWLFVALNGWLGIQFLLWVRYCERGGTGLSVPRPAGAEGWLPIAGLMNTKYFLLTGRVPAIHPAAMVLFIAFMLMSLLLKKAFCSWLCPVGTLSEHLWKLGRRIFSRNLHPPKWLDIPLRGLKYVLLGFFVFVIGGMSAEAIHDFMSTPYGLVADVKMLNFFRDIGQTAVIVIALLVLLSMLIQNFWCRYLCPYGSLLGITSLLSPIKIRRDVEACIDCGKCARACPSRLPVDQLVQIRSVECAACMACVAACPAEHALQFSFASRKASTPAERWRRRVLSPIAVAATLACIFLGLVVVAKATGHWRTNLPPEAYMDLVSHARQARHPGM
ncbi:MAG: 4Fe-4S binding protein [Terracidiphilus sp.]